MGFEIIESQYAKTTNGFTALSRTDEPELMVWSPVLRNRLSRTMSVFWRGSLPQGGLEEAWKQARLELVSAKCTLMINSKDRPTKTVWTVPAIEQFVTDNAASSASLTSLMKVRPEIGPAKPKHSMLYLWGQVRGLSGGLVPEGGPTSEFGVRLNRQNWKQPEIRQFILNIFRRSCAAGEVTQSDLESLTEKISQLARPKKMRKAAPATPQAIV